MGQPRWRTRLRVAPGRPDLTPQRRAEARRVGGFFFKSAGARRP